jgi:hypothetical protein
MSSRKTSIAGALACTLILAACAAQGPATPVAPAAAQVQPQVPQAIQLSHASMLAELTELTHHRGNVGVVAAKALPMVEAHFKREQEYIMPPLSLAHSLADGKVSADMRWAVTMADRIKASREAIFQEHTQITEVMNELLAAAQRAHDTTAEEFARTAVEDSLEDMEVAEPMAIVIGEYLRLRLPPQ